MRVCVLWVCLHMCTDAWYLFHVVPFVYRLTQILKITRIGLFNVINQKGIDWLLLNMIKWSSELSLHVPNKLFESIQALKTRFCLRIPSHADPNWMRNETRQNDSNNDVFLYICGRVQGGTLWSKYQRVRVTAMPEWWHLWGWLWPVWVLLFRR